VSERPSRSHRVSKGELNVVTSVLPIAPNTLQELSFASPKMCATVDVAEKRLGLRTVLQTDQGREALTLESQLTEGTDVGRIIGGEEDGPRQERLGLG
jgi:hypothetical protein